MSASEFVLKNHLHIKLWTQSSPIVPFTDIPPPSSYYKYTIVLELFQPRGGRFLYGLLGAEVDINLKNSEIILNLTKHDLENRIFQSDFLNELDEAKYGLPIEYTTELQKFILEISNQMKFNDLYKINFCFSAHSDIGSNIKIFKFLALLILQYIQNSDLTLDDLNQTQGFLDQNI
ncbi:hypothetical protein [Acinetobacter modestus]|uniref:Uncharacterized protein n=1 Tax=Acinetobacter modestus TaxID=1776740 RepID=A0ABN0JQ43_9GAMM|nr:hypothetical protein [Acinetobacter modestus]ENU27479.1 hypothetical protein F992_01316 [Acinetobacter modestus]GGA15543.1 hypothetical protein GCM10017554_10070 [Acinetobacter modestus]